MVELLIDFAHYGPEACLQILPNSPHRELYAAIVCGQSLGSSEMQRLMLDTGLIHILVVSGAHLAFLESFLAPCPRVLSFSILTAYSWLTGWGPPIVRALVRRFVQELGFPRGFSGLQIDAITNAVLLGLFPNWVYSRSFLMSWVCGLAMLAPVGPVALRCYLFIFPFAPSSVVSIFWNALLAPLLGHLLFPLCLLTVLAPPLVSVTDFTWELFLEVLKAGPQAPAQGWYLQTKSLFWLPFTIHSLLLIGEVPWRRAWAFSSPS